VKKFVNRVLQQLSSIETLLPLHFFHSRGSLPIMACYTRCEQLSARTFLVVEQDRFGQYPFMYVILGEDKCILIDSGCGSGDYRDFVTTRINKARLPYLVISTHVHFDHIGANHRFCGAHKEGLHL
jgi:glyoxylase-like metal-dependent hydrolase (beta-lactamase superfamily II)